MREYYEIHPSRVLPGLNIAIHAWIATAIAVYVDSLLLMPAAVTLVLLLGWRETAPLLRQRRFRLMLDCADATISLERRGQPHFRGKYKVYATRWFAILKLIDKRKSRILILHPERFDSIQSYRHLRFALARGGDNDAA